MELVWYLITGLPFVGAGVTLEIMSALNFDVWGLCTVFICWYPIKGHEDLGDDRTRAYGPKL